MSSKNNDKPKTIKPKKNKETQKNINKAIRQAFFYRILNKLSHIKEQTISKTGYALENTDILFIGGIVLGVLFSFFVGSVALKKLSGDELKNKFYSEIKLYNDNEVLKIRKLNSKEITYGTRKKQIQIPYGDNMFSTLLAEGIDRQNANDIVIILGRSYDMRNIRSEQVFDLEYDFNSQLVPDEYTTTLPKSYHIVESRIVKKLEFKDIREHAKYSIVRNGDSYSFSVERPEMIKKIRTVQGTITTNLYTDVVENSGVRASTLYNVLNEYAFLIDFQRDIHMNDQYVFVLNTTKDGDGEVISEEVLYMDLVLSGKDYEIFNLNGKYYDRKGESVKKALLKSPIDGARVSSNFSGRRKHPILGYTRAHLGVDLAAPTGTPIYAAGDGVIVEKSFSNGYGNFITIQHNRRYKTRYAHMSRFAKVRVGQRVSQRQTIGYVGMTGLATGPHLHYEVMQDGKHVNPSTFKANSTIKLKQEQMGDLLSVISNIDKILDKNQNKIAEETNKK